ncbi:MAG: hypothetical protein MUQ65_08490, partial [Armatimonadetes bacterium]|nr:hypothetical protein [Armatimonadota bacterium]
MLDEAAGCAAGGIEEVPDRLNSLLDSEYVINLPESAASLSNFEEAFGELKERSERGKTVLLVSPRIPWDLEWVRFARRKLSQFKSK